MSYRPLNTGAFTQVGALTTLFTIPHGLVTPPKFCNVAPGNALTAVNMWWDWDATNINVHITLAGLTGTAVFNWLAVG